MNVFVYYEKWYIKICIEENEPVSNVQWHNNLSIWKQAEFNNAFTSCNIW